MAKTDFYAELKLIDTTALEDSQPESSSNQNFANIQLLKSNNVQTDYGTLEKDFFILDGSKKEMPDTIDDVAFFTSKVSDENGTFTSEQSITINFSKNHSSYGLTLYFADDHPLEIKIKWYDAWNIVQESLDFNVDSNIYFAQKQVQNYRKIKIIFTKTLPYRYVKLNYIEYGTLLSFGGTNGLPIKNAKLIEETDPLSDKIAIDKLSFNLIDENEEYNPANAGGLHQVLQKGQVVYGYECRNNTVDFLGKYFINTWKNTNNIVQFSLQDYKGQLDDYNFIDGKVYNGETAGLIIKQIMAAANIAESEYVVEENVADIQLYGYLKIQSCRKALREVLFATCAVIDTAREEKIHIHKLNKKSYYTIDRTRKFSTTVENNDYVSDVTVKYNQYTMANELRDIVKGNYEKGIHQVNLNNPARNLQINNGNIIKSNDNYVIFELDQDAEIIIKGNQYTKEELSVTKSVVNIQAGQTRVIKTYSSSLANADIASQIATNALAYYNLTLGIKTKFINDGEHNGKWGIVQNPNKKLGDFIAVMEKMTTDLTGGYITTSTLRGYYDFKTDSYYTNEIYTGEEIGII